MGRNKKDGWHIFIIPGRQQNILHNKLSRTAGRVVAAADALNIAPVFLKSPTYTERLCIYENQTEVCTTALHQYSIRFFLQESCSSKLASAPPFSGGAIYSQEYYYVDSVTREGKVNLLGGV